MGLDGCSAISEVPIEKNTFSPKKIVTSLKRWMKP